MNVEKKRILVERRVILNGLCVVCAYVDYVFVMDDRCELIEVEAVETNQRAFTTLTTCVWPCRMQTNVFDCSLSTAGSFIIHCHPISYLISGTVYTRGLKYVAKHRKQRIAAIASGLAASDYDVVALQELWVFADYEHVRASVANHLPHSKFFYRRVLLLSLNPRVLICTSQRRTGSRTCFVLQVPHSCCNSAPILPEWHAY